MSKNQDPELETKLTDIRARIASVDHDTFKGDCQAFRDAIMAIVPADDMGLLVASDRLLQNMCCLFMQAGEAFAMDQLASGMAHAVQGETLDLPGMRISVMAVNRRRAKKDEPKTPPTA